MFGYSVLLPIRKTQFLVAYGEEEEREDLKCLIFCNLLYFRVTASHGGKQIDQKLGLGVIRKEGSASDCRLRPGKGPEYEQQGVTCNFYHLIFTLFF